MGCPNANAGAVSGCGPPEPPKRVLGAFPAPVVVLPTSAPHALTIIFLHGRGSDAHMFHGPLLSTRIRGGATFGEALGSARLVFPTAPLMRASKYRRSVLRQWYDGSGDWEPEARGNMRASVEHVHAIIRAEAELVGGDAGSVVLAGLSQGCAMSLVSLLLWDGDPLGAAVGMCGFIPFNACLMETLDGAAARGTGDEDGVVFAAAGTEHDARAPLQRAIDELREEVELPGAPTPSSFFQSTPVFLGHGTDDDSVALHHGQQAAVLLGTMGISVELHTYQGLGHRYSPEMLGHVATFLGGKPHLRQRQQRPMRQ